MTWPSVFKKARDRQRKGSAWYINYTDEHGVRRQVKGCSDKTATEAMARKLESEAELKTARCDRPQAGSVPKQQCGPGPGRTPGGFRALPDQQGRGCEACPFDRFVDSPRLAQCSKLIGSPT